MKGRAIRLCLFLFPREPACEFHNKSRYHPNSFPKPPGKHSKGNFPLIYQRSACRSLHLTGFKKLQAGSVNLQISRLNFQVFQQTFLLPPDVLTVEDVKNDQGRIKYDHSLGQRKNRQRSWLILEKAVHPVKAGQNGQNRAQVFSHPPDFHRLSVEMADAQILHGPDKALIFQALCGPWRIWASAISTGRRWKSGGRKSCGSILPILTAFYGC